MAFSRTQIDRLGDRLRKDDVSEDDLGTLDDYRQSFTDAYQAVVAAVRGFGLNATGRPVKTTGSIIDKLRRESIRLSQIQDIAGCRVVVNTTIEQDEVTSQLGKAFEKIAVFDRRIKPSHDYRAVHVVVHLQGKAVEVQIRTPLQHAWAELSEKLSDVLDPKIKYGGGTDGARKLLADGSHLGMVIEAREAEILAAGTGNEENSEFFALKQQFKEMLEEFANNWRNR